MFCNETYVPISKSLTFSDMTMMNRVIGMKTATGKQLLLENGVSLFVIFRISSPRFLEMLSLEGLIGQSMYLLSHKIHSLFVFAAQVLLRQGDEENTHMRIGNWNVRTLYAQGKTAQVTKAMREARWCGLGKFILSTGETIVYSGSDDEVHQHGVAIMLNKNAAKATGHLLISENFEPDSILGMSMPPLMTLMKR